MITSVNDWEYQDFQMDHMFTSQIFLTLLLSLGIHITHVCSYDWLAYSSLEKYFLNTQANLDFSASAPLLVFSH